MKNEQDIWASSPAKKDAVNNGESINLSAIHIPQWGDRCPKCGEAELDYNGVLELVCSCCGYRVPEGSAFT